MQEILLRWPGRAIRLRIVRRALAIASHVVAVVATYYLSFSLRFDGVIADPYLSVFWRTLPVLVSISLLTFAVFNLYSGMLSYFSVPDLLRLSGAQAVTIGLFALIYFATNHWSLEGFPRSIFALEFILLVGWMATVRLVLRFAREHVEHRRGRGDQAKDRVLLVGDLSNVDLLLRGARGRGVGQFVGVVSDREDNDGQRFRGLRVYFSRPEGIGRIAKWTRADCVLILPPYDRPQQINAIVGSCSEEGIACKFRTIPSLAALASGDLTASSIRKVDIEDLLPRPVANLDRVEVRRSLRGRRVMVTGAGGSIGSELCRQVASYEPAGIVLFESCEFALYTIEQDLRMRFPNLKIFPVCGDIRHPEEIRAGIDAAGGVDVIYHAAAYKHVPLMELNIGAAFRTNVLGTARLADVAVERGVQRFVMISSDKAVRPSSIMGATKRMAERVIAERDPGNTTFVAVRFGNVLESSGSVIPLFKRCIAEGKPLPVTSPDVRRFFMTISEAVDLVLQAGSVGQTGDVMVLEMGESVKIIDLARRLIELSGLIPGKDIEIEIVGLRPGEKEYEEVMTEDEDVIKTAYEKIWVMRKNGDPVPEPSPGHAAELARIELCVTQNDAAALRKLAARYVPENAFAEPSGRESSQPASRLFPFTAGSVNGDRLSVIGDR